MALNELEERIRKGNQMFADLALTETIDEVRFQPELFEMTRTIAHEYSDNRSEQGGFLGGVVKNGIFYIFDHHRRGSGIEGVLEFNYDLRPIDFSRFERIFGSIPGYKTIIYHNHPRVTQMSMVDEIGIEALDFIRTIKTDFDNGIYAELGIRDLDDAVNEELSRVLSPTDVRNTPGRYNLVISPTFSGDSLSSHLNFYDLRSGTFRFSHRLVPCKTCNPEEISQETQIYERTTRQWFIETFGCLELGDFSEEQHRRAYYLVNGLPVPDNVMDY